MIEDQNHQVSAVPAIPASPNKLGLGFHQPTQFSQENYNAFLQKNKNRISGGFRIGMAKTQDDNKHSYNSSSEQGIIMIREEDSKRSYSSHKDFDDSLNK